MMSTSMMWKPLQLLVLGAIIAPAVVSGQACKSLATVAENKYPSLAGALGAAGLLPIFDDKTLSATAYTVFAPSEDAFASALTLLNITTPLAELPEEQVTILRLILQSHVVEGTYLAVADFTDGQVLTTLSGANMTVSVTGDTIKVSLSPTSSATVTNGDASTDLCGGSVVHVIDTVLIPPEAGIALPCTTIAAAATTSLPKLAAALTATDLLPVFSESANAVAYTVFGPDDAAFDAALTSLGVSLDSLDDATKEKLADVLKSHVVEGTFLAADLSDGQVLTTLSGANLTVSIMDSTVKVSISADSSATVTAADAAVGLCGDSVVHVIDTVLMPPADTVEGDSNESATSPPATVAASPPPPEASAAYPMSTAAAMTVLAGVFAMLV